MDEQVRAYIEHHSPLVQEIALRLRELVLNAAPGLSEYYHDGYKMIFYGTGRKTQDAPLYIALQKNDVNLGIVRGTQLPDPTHKLRGTGKSNRHVKITKPDDVDDPALAALIKAAVG